MVLGGFLRVALPYECVACGPHAAIAGEWQLRRLRLSVRWRLVCFLLACPGFVPLLTNFRWSDASLFVILMCGLGRVMLTRVPAAARWHCHLLKLPPFYCYPLDSKPLVKYVLFPNILTAATHSQTDSCLPQECNNTAVADSLIKSVTLFLPCLYSAAKPKPLEI